MHAEDLKTIGRRYIEESSRNLAVLDEILAKDAVVHFGGLPEPVRGRENVKQLFGAYQTAFPDIAASVEDAIAEGNRVAVRWTVRGSHGGPFQGIPPTGRSVTVTGMNILQIEGGQIVEDWSQFDALGMMQQLGVIPAPGQAT